MVMASLHCLPDVAEHLNHLGEVLRDCPCSHLHLDWCGCGCCCLCLGLGCLIISESELEIEELACTTARATEDAYAWLALGCADCLAENEPRDSFESSVLPFLMTMADLVSAVLQRGVESPLCEASLDEDLFLDALALSEGVLDVREVFGEECEGCLRRVLVQLIN